MPTTLKDHLKAVNRTSILMPVVMDFIADENRAVREGKASHKANVVSDAKATITAMKSRIAEFNHGEPPQDTFFVHPSSVGSCMRMLWYAHFDAPREGRSKADELKSYLIFEVGTYFHVLFQNLLHRVGVLLKREVAIVDTDNFILGHCDGIVRVDGKRYVLEIKTMNSRQFILLNAPKHAHLQQAHCYMKSLGIRRAIFVYYDKDRSEVKEFVIKFSNTFYALHVLPRIKKLRKNVRLKRLPPRETEGANVPPCTYCDFASLCYSLDHNKKFVRSLHETQGKDKH